MSDDPMFCDAENGDLRLHSDSNCAYDNNPECGYIGACYVGCGITTSVDDVSGGEARILTSRPNPFGSTSTIQYVIPHEADETSVRLAVYDATGRLVRTLVNERHSAGIHDATWDGLNRSGSRVPAGVYFYELVWNGKSSSRRMIVLR
jgi:flagellar hook assembly protein FlgD